MVELKFAYFYIRYLARKNLTGFTRVPIVAQTWVNNEIYDFPYGQKGLNYEL